MSLAKCLEFMSPSLSSYWAQTKAFLGSVIYQQGTESLRKNRVGTWEELSFAQVSPTKIAQAVPELGLVLGATNPDRQPRLRSVSSELWCQQGGRAGGR